MKGEGKGGNRRRANLPSEGALVLQFPPRSQTACGERRGTSRDVVLAHSISFLTGANAPVRKGTNECEIGDPGWQKGKGSDQIACSSSLVWQLFKLFMRLSLIFFQCLG